MTGDDMPRPLSETERDVIARLLSVPFPGRDELRAQLPLATVEGRCGCGCVTVSLAVDRAAAPATVLSGAPVSADISDDEFDAGIVLLVDGEGYLCSWRSTPSLTNPSGGSHPSSRSTPVCRFEPQLQLDGRRRAGHRIHRHDRGLMPDQRRPVR
ncbi:hypothetical protein V6V47_13820 [Micromonospora sp. CPCC 205539]|uniref:hypothetical protein n=1 Tax=Micromonospora sp. CPCC 205539 TaxID=3122408 RepID=UPI002FF43ABA